MDQLLQIADQLGIDQSFFLIFGIIAALHLVLSAVYLKPYQKLLHERKTRTEGARKEADILSRKAEEKYTHYKDRLKETHEHARVLFGQAEAAAKREEAKILNDAATKTKDLVLGAQKELDGQRKGLIESLSKEASNIAAGIVEKILGRAV